MLTLTLACCLATAGCQSGKGDGWKFASWDVRKTMGWKKDKPDPEIPARMVATWTDTVLNTAGQPAKRGFGGRLVFFAKDSKDPVRVDGQLVVYAFDESKRQEHETHPTRRYIFPAPDFARFESESTLGSSYSVWLPWDEVGGAPTKVSLIARFEPVGGAIVMGEQTRHYLPGIGEDGQQTTQFVGTAATKNVQEIDLAAYNTAGQPSAAAAEIAAKPLARMTTSTIPLPSRLSEAALAPRSSAGVANQGPLGSGQGAGAGTTDN